MTDEHDRQHSFQMAHHAVIKQRSERAVYSTRRLPDGLSLTFARNVPRSPWIDLPSKWSHTKKRLFGSRDCKMGFLLWILAIVIYICEDDKTNLLRSRNSSAIRRAPVITSYKWIAPRACLPIRSCDPRRKHIESTTTLSARSVINICLFYQRVLFKRTRALNWVHRDIYGPTRKIGRNIDSNSCKE